LGNKIFRVGLAPYGQTVGFLFCKVFLSMNQPCTLGVFLTKTLANPLEVLFDWAIIYFTGDLAPYGQTVGSMFWKIFFIDESSMYIGCIPEKMGLST
jgi:hypothetical protein